MDNERFYLSVVIPFHNSSDDVLGLLDSIGWRHSFLEFILVDDGSIDGSGSLVEDVIQPFSNMRMVVLPHNIGVSAARNRGIDAARGDYVWFVDSDDKIARGALPAVLRFLQVCSEPFDVLFFGWCSIAQDNESKFEFLPSAIPARDALKMVYEGDGYVWNKIFNRDTLVKVGVRFNESIFWAEDKLFCAEFIAGSTGRILHISNRLYVHMKNIESFTSNKKADSKHLSLLAAEHELVELARQFDDVDLQSTAKSQLAHDSLMMAARLLAQRPEGWRNQFVRCYNSAFHDYGDCLRRNELSVKYQAINLLCRIAVKLIEIISRVDK